ncbi:MAG: hypothetical protein JNK82_15350 [Myxococcaceae bacterium]|nr:hypothetical protein [Myxococcaceae bacterium]
MKVGQALLDVVNRAQRLLERVEVQPTEVQNVLQERRYRDTFSGGRSQVDNWLANQSFKAQYQQAVSGTSYRAAEAKKIQAAHFQDSFTAFRRAPVKL